MKTALQTEYGMNDVAELEQTLANKKEKIKQSVICQPLFV